MCNTTCESPDALVAAYGSVLTAIDPADGTHEAYSPGYRPDLVALQPAPCA